MEGLTKLLGGIASLLWPLIVIVGIFILKPLVTSLLESAKTRKFTLEIGGQKLTMEEVNEQQRNLIADLQAQVVALREKVNSSLPASDVATENSKLTIWEQRKAILWVDDEPKNNSYLVQQLLDHDLKVDRALTTSECLGQLNHGQYRLVVSDMGRDENGSYNKHAGIDLLKSMREQNYNTPVVIFTSRNGIENYGKEALSLGAKGVTNSPTELWGLINHILGQ